MIDCSNGTRLRLCCSFLVSFFLVSSYARAGPSADEITPNPSEIGVKSRDSSSAVQPSASADSDSRSSASTASRNQSSSQKNIDTDQRAQESQTPPSNSTEKVAPGKTHLERAFWYFSELRPDRAGLELVPLIVNSSKKLSPNRAWLSARYYCLMGRAMYYDENYLAAAQLYSIAHRLQPNNDTISALLMDSCLRIGQVERAKVLFDKLSTISQTPFIENTLADYQIRSSNFIDAVKRLRAILAKHPHDWRAHLLLGRCLSKVGQTDDALVEWGLAAEFAPNPYYALLLKSSIHAKNPDLKIKELREAGKYHPDDPAWHIHLATSLLESGKTDEALAEMVAAVQCPRMYCRSFYTLANFYSDHKSPVAALQCLSYLEKYLPWSIDVVMGRAKIAKNENDLVKAEALYRRAIQLNRFTTTPYLGLAKIQENRGEKQQAIDTLRSVLKVTPNNCRLWRAVAELQLALGRWQEAKESYEHTLTLFVPTSDLSKLNAVAKHDMGTCHAGIGTYYYKIHDLDKALQKAILYNQLKFIPTNLPRYLTLINLYPGRIDITAGLTKEREAHKHVLIADMLMQTGQFNECVDEYHKALQLNPDDVDVHSYLLLALNQTGNWVEWATEDLELSRRLVGKIPQKVMSSGKPEQSEQEPQTEKQ